MSPQRDAQRLERFVADFSERGYQFAFRLCGDAEAAKELLQEAFCRLWRNWGNYDRARCLEGWFISILRSIYLDGVRSSQHRKTVSLDGMVRPGLEPGCTWAESLADPGEAAVLDRLEREDDVARVSRALEGLSPEHRAILTLFDVEDLSYDQIAEVLDCAVGTVRSRLARARAALKDAMLESSAKVDAHGL